MHVFPSYSHSGSIRQTIRRRTAAMTAVAVSFVTAPPLWAAEAPAAGGDPLTDSVTIMQRGFNAVITAGAAAAFVVAMAVVIMHLAAVFRERKTWGEVGGAIFGAGTVALIAGAIAVIATTSTGNISAA